MRYLSIITVSLTKLYVERKPWANKINLFCLMQNLYVTCERLQISWNIIYFKKW